MLLRCGLTVSSDEVIPMDGNSWYQSVVQQLKRPEIARYIGAHGRPELLTNNGTFTTLCSRNLRQPICKRPQELPFYIKVMKIWIAWVLHGINILRSSRLLANMFQIYSYYRYTAWQIGVNTVISVF